MDIKQLFTVKILEHFKQQGIDPNKVKIIFKDDETFDIEFDFSDKEKDLSKKSSLINNKR
jgi:hypothetical protein